MKFILQSPKTRELLHNWRAGSIEVQASFFFHYRGTAMQKSFEGVLRSLIIQLLKPHHSIYRTKHQPTWDKYQALKLREINAKSRLKVTKHFMTKTRGATLDARNKL